MIQRWLSSGTLHHVVWQKITNVSDELTASYHRYNVMMLEPV